MDDEKLLLLKKIRAGEIGVQEALRQMERPFDLWSYLREDLKSELSRLLKLRPEEFDLDRPFIDYGLTSVSSTELAQILSSRFQIKIAPTVFFEFQNLRDFSSYLIEQFASELNGYYVNKTKTKPELLRKPHREAPVESVGLSVSEPELPEPDLSVPERGPAPDDKYRLEDLWEIVAAELKTEAEESYTSILISPPDGPPAEVVTIGSGEPLLMLGGLAERAEMWKHQIPALARGRRLYMVHQPGVGRSGLDQENFSWSAIIKSLLQVMDALNLSEPLPVLGYSLGGMLAQQLCLDYPERFSSLVLLCTSSYISDEQSLDFRTLVKELEGNREFFRINRELDMKLLPLYGQVIREFDLRTRLGEILMPVLIIAAEHDMYMKPEYSRSMQAQISRARLEIIPDAAHLAPLTHGAEINEILLSFLYP